MEIYEFTLAERDNYLKQIENQIQAKRNLLLEKRRTLENSIAQNKFLEGVRNDYQKYHNYIVKQNQDQMRAMDILNQYLGDIVVSGKLTEKDIHNTKREQKNILREMDQIKRNLDEIIYNGRDN
jgi:hypothetical protein